MKKDANNDFLDNFNVKAGGDYLRVMEFSESGAMYGDQINGGKVPNSTLFLRNFPATFVGFVHKSGAVIPSFTGKRNFLARTVYASSYTNFSTAYVSGTLNITNAPTATATGTASMVATPAGGVATTLSLTIDKLAAGTFGVYHMHGAFGTAKYLDITWPIGGKKALYVLSNNASGAGMVTDVGEAFLTL